MFLLFGFSYDLVRSVVGTSRFLRFERALGQVDFFGLEGVPMVGFLMLGIFMMAASWPVNYYWYRRQGLPKHAADAG